DRRGEVEEEGPILVSVNERQRFLGQQVVTVLDLLRRHSLAKLTGARHYILQRHTLLVAHEEAGVIVMGMVLVEVTVERIEALPGRHPGGALMPQAPLAHQARRITG